MRLQIRTVVFAVNKHASACAQWGTVLSALGTLAALGVAYEAFSVQNAQLLEEQALVLIGVEGLADFMDTAYAQRDTLHPDSGEWNTWWNSFVDCYDENPILQDMLVTNSDEYSVATMLRPEHRFEQYIGATNRRRR